jgi:uncharacterized protein YjiS (DUF1127 family)
MQFESQWPGDAIAAPYCPAGGREDALFERPGGRSWNRVDSRADQADADPTAAVHRRIQLARPLSKTNRRGRCGAAVMSLVINHVVEGFALSATSLHPEFSLLGGELARRERETGTGAYRPLACLQTARGDVAGRRTWIFSITSFFAEIWSRMLRERKFRQIRAAWEMIDDRTLRDIGISRYEIEYAKDPRN